MTIGEKIRFIRLEKGMTQKQVAEKCGMADSAIRKYESGTQTPKIETLRRIATALDVAWVELTGEQTFEYIVGKKAFADLKKNVDSFNAILSLLRDLYGDVEDKETSGGSNYYLVGQRGNQFVLYEQDIEALKKLALSTIPAMVDQLKDTRPEQTVIEELEELERVEDVSMIPDYQKDKKTADGD